MPRARLAVAVVAAVLILLPVAAALADQPFWVTVATQVVIVALAVAALDFVVGYGGLISFGHAAFFAIGAYTVAFAAQHGSHAALVNWALAVLLAGVVAAAIGALSVRTAGIFFIMITLAFAQMVFYLTTGIKALGGDDGLPMDARDTIPGIDLANPTVFYAVALLALGVFTFLAQRATRARFGTVLRAAKQNERRARSLGFDVYRYRVAAFAISGAITGLSGALFADFQRIATTDYANWVQSGDLLVMVILGGTGTLLGPVLGSAVFTLLRTVLLGLTAHWSLVLGCFLIVVVLAGRRGLAGLVAGRDA